MSNHQSDLPSLKLHTSKSQFKPSSSYLSTSMPPTKLSDYLKDRSVSRCKQLIKMISVDNPSKLNKAKSSTLILQKNKKLQNLSEEILKELTNIIFEMKRSIDIQELDETETVFKKCLNLLKGTKEEETRSSEKGEKSMLEIQIERVLKIKNKKEPYFRERRKSNEMMTSMRILEKCSMNNMDSILERSNNTLENSDKNIVKRERKSRMDMD